jgi:hypothetical protein
MGFSIQGDVIYTPRLINAARSPLLRFFSASTGGLAKG